MRGVAAVLRRWGKTKEPVTYYLTKPLTSFTTWTKDNIPYVSTDLKSLCQRQFVTVKRSITAKLSTDYMADSTVLVSCSDDTIVLHTT